MMFGSNPKPTTATEGPVSNGNGNHHHSAYNNAPNRLSADVSIKGSVTFSSELVIDGQVEGDITSDGKLIVGEHGKVVGDIQAGSVTIQGSVRGNILASERCALNPGASLQGDIEAPRFAVDETATFIGSATIKASSRG